MTTASDKSIGRGIALSRRHFLRGVGVSIALPTLPSLMTRAARAEARESRRPVERRLPPVRRCGWRSCRSPTACNRTIGCQR